MKKITKISNEQPSSKDKLRVAAYCRVSTSSAEQLDSLNAQREHYNTFIKNNDEWKFAGIFYDEGISGTKAKSRKGLYHLLDACENGRVDLVLTKSISRFARNTTDCLSMVRRMMDLGVHIIFEKENIDTRSMESELMLSILAGLAESESRSISENYKWGAKKRFENGTYIISSPPYGYANRNEKMEVIPEEAEVVKRIFAMSLSGMGTDKIARALNEENIQTKKGNRWQGSTVNAILKNEKYIGDALFQKTYTDRQFKRHRNNGEQDQYLFHNHHEAIVSREDFEKVQELRKIRAKEKGNHKGKRTCFNRYSFTGKVICSHCYKTFIRKIIPKKDFKYIIWACKTHNEDKEKCPQQSIKEVYLEQAFITMMNKLIFSYDRILVPLLDTILNLEHGDYASLVSYLDGKIAECKASLSNLKELYAKGVLDAPIFQEAKLKIQAEEDQINEEKAELINRENSYAVKEKELKNLISFVSHRDMYDEFSEEAFETFVDNIIVNGRETVTFCLKCGLNLKERIEQ